VEFGSARDVKFFRRIAAVDGDFQSSRAADEGQQAAWGPIRIAAADADGLPRADSDSSFTQGSARAPNPRH
jgi:hypothetical protein